MTNEEIDAKASAALTKVEAIAGVLSLGAATGELGSCRIETVLERQKSCLVEAMRNIATQAYEEAIEKIEANNRQVSPTLPSEGYYDGYVNACNQNADDIRTLKDSLAQPTLS